MCRSDALVTLKLSDESRACQGNRFLGPGQASVIMMFSEGAAARRIHAALGTVVCAGAWAGQLLDAAAGTADFYTRLITPLRGHLLQLPAAAAGGVLLRRGVMEMQYLKVPSMTTCARCMRRTEPPHAVDAALC